MIEYLDFDSTGRRLVSTADDGTAVVWNLADGDRIWSFSGLGGLIAVSAMFAPSGAHLGDRLYLASHDGTLLDVNLAGALLGSPAAAAPAEDVAAWPVGHVMNADGTNQTRLTTDPAGDFGAAWSPDGTQIAFASSRGSASGANTVYIMNADGSDQHPVHPFGSQAVPAWQPEH